MSLRAERINNCLSAFLDKAEVISGAAARSAADCDEEEIRASGTASDEEASEQLQLSAVRAQNRPRSVQGGSRGGVLHQVLVRWIP